MKINFKRILNYLLKFSLAFLLLSFTSVIIYRFIPIPYTALMFWKSTSALIDGKPAGIYKKWVPINEISKAMQTAVIKAEDDKFYQHHGFDFEAIDKAMKYNKTHKKQKGASTISQQTAKNVFLWPSRNWIRKGMEVYFTVLIEILWSKERILEAYLNVIELGPGVYGVEAASQKYFHNKAKTLTSSQASLIAAVLPNPIKFKIDKPSAYVLKRQRKIMGRGFVVATEKSSEEIAQKIENVSHNSEEFFDIKFDEEEGPSADSTNP